MTSRISLRGLRRLIRDDNLLKCPNVPYRVLQAIYSLPNDKILPWSKLKVFVNDKLKAARMAEYVLDRGENKVGK